MSDKDLDNDKNKKTPPNPEEIQKDFKEFFKNKYGATVQFMGADIKQGGPFEQPETAEPKKKKKRSKHTQYYRDFDLRPRDIKQHLDKFVIKQDEAKKALSIAVCDHYNKVKTEITSDKKEKDHNYSKQNVLMLGPTGVGKTYLVKLIADYLGVPFVKADATRFSETGYVGANVDDLVRDLVTQADGDMEAARFGIVYLDEVDKIATPPDSMGRDVNGRGVQFGLLKMMEETDVDLRAAHDISSQMQALMEFQQKGKVGKQVINTKHILFIVSGAFHGLTNIIRQRMNKRSMGISATVQHAKDSDEYFEQVSTEDLIKFGFEPEFVGRLPVRVSCHSLNAEDLYHVLKNSKGSIINQYKEAFQAYGIGAKFSDQALREIANLAHSEKTGARALMTVCEKILRDYKYELPSVQPEEFLITEDVVKDPAGQLEGILKQTVDLADVRWNEEINHFEDYFFKQHQLKIQFDEESRKLVKARAKERNISAEKFCLELFQSAEDALQLIKRANAQNPLGTWTIDKSIFTNPQAAWDAWVRFSYSKGSGPQSDPSHPSQPLH